MADLTQDQVGKALANAGNYRVRRAQIVALEGEPDGISGSLILSLGLRETGLRNIEGGAKIVDGKWVPEDDPNRMDVGIFQISRRWHMRTLEKMLGVEVKTWAPVVPGKTASMGGYAPRFEESLRFTIQGLQEAMAYAEDNGISKQADQVKFAVAAHNGGMGGALKGHREGNVDKYTTGGDYSAWVIRHKTLVNRWLGQHPNWKG